MAQSGFRTMPESFEQVDALSTCRLGWWTHQHVPITS